MKKWMATCMMVSMLTAGRAQTYQPVDYIRVLKEATDVMINDVTSPVAAARYYSYITLAGNQAQSVFEPRFSLGTALNGLAWQVNDLSSENAESSFTVLYSLYRMSARLLPSGPVLQPKADSLRVNAQQRGLKEEVIRHSVTIADSIVARLLRYVQADRFREMSSLKKYTPTKGDAYWQPTAPGYMQALEPNWNTLRLFVLPGIDSFRSLPAAPFDTSSQSSFFKQLTEVYTTVNHLSRKQVEIASFWDCNPFALQQMGHVEFGLKKMSPGGHWIGITGIACIKAGKSFQQTVLIHTLASLTLCDAFVCCWHEKYSSNRVRPETAIRRWIDPAWKPFLQTPPFPEYTSGHSVISSACSVLLSEIFGYQFGYTDNTEAEFGLRSRKYKSFLQASGEAAISRLYGGIHYRDAVENGVVQGKNIGGFISRQLKTFVELSR